MNRHVPQLIRNMKQLYETGNDIWQLLKVPVLLLLIIIIASLPVFTPFLPIGYDTIFHLVRMEGIKEGILAGQVPVRVEPIYLEGEGYAVSLFYGGLFFYFPAFLRILGFPLQFSFKCFIILINTMTVVNSYILFKEIGKGGVERIKKLGNNRSCHIHALVL